MSRLHQNGSEGGTVAQWDTVKAFTIDTEIVEYGVTDLGNGGGIIPARKCSRYGSAMGIGQFLFASPLSEFYVRGYFFVDDTLPFGTDQYFWMTGCNETGVLCRFHGGNQNSRITVRLTPSGELKTYRGNHTGAGGFETTLIDTTAAIISAQTWYVYECYVKIANSGGRFVQRVYEPGETPVTVTDFTGDTQASGGTVDDATVMNWVAFAGTDAVGGTQFIVWDDCALNSAVGALNNSWLGEGELLGFFPTGMGTGTNNLLGSPEATNRYLNVDEVPAGTSDYNYESTVGRYDLYTFDDIVLAPGPVSVFARASYPGSTSTFKIVRKSGGTEFRSAALAVLLCDNAAGDVAAPYYRSLVDETDPATSLPWTEAGFNALEAGFEVATAAEIRLHAIHLEAESDRFCGGGWGWAPKPDPRWHVF